MLGASIRLGEAIGLVSGARRGNTGRSPGHLAAQGRRSTAGWIVWSKRFLRGRALRGRAIRCRSRGFRLCRRRQSRSKVFRSRADTTGTGMAGGSSLVLWRGWTGSSRIWKLCGVRCQTPPRALDSVSEIAGSVRDDIHRELKEELDRRLTAVEENLRFNMLNMEAAQGENREHHADIA